MAALPTPTNTSSPPINDGTPPTTVTNTAPPLVISNITNLIPVKLGSSNYLLWKSLFEPILRGHKLMHLLDGTIPTPIAVESPLYEKDQMLISWINATLSESALPYIVGICSAKKAWDVLKQRQFGSSVRIRSRTSQLSLEELHTLLICEELELALADETPNENSTAFVAYRPRKINTGRRSSSFRGRSNNGGRGSNNGGRGDSGIPNNHFSHNPTPLPLAQPHSATPTPAPLIELPLVHKNPAPAVQHSATPTPAQHIELLVQNNPSPPNEHSTHRTHSMQTRSQSGIFNGRLSLTPFIIFLLH
ncbi:hypothetical protein NE237_010817 [Protea cynaroides]|uniref:Retrotransposon Copia-like N-terminal domain-containing protein n=1 Tax=Protea cynaroides TaxID=273540 RepID=A0A9Q0R1Z6_9MAGN|nr:hypothetical protein NE237_010817 [Protea cynaroides]